MVAVSNVAGPLRGEIRSLTGLRAVAAFGVVLFHFGLDAVSGGGPWRRMLGGGFTAVSFFFALSGFVLAHRYADEQLSDVDARARFWVKRFARIYPLYASSLALGCLAGWPKSVQDLGASRGVVRVLLQAALLNAWSHISMFAWNWAAWSLSVEAAFYFLFPWLFLNIRRQSTKHIWIILAMACVATVVAPSLYTWCDPDGLGRAARIGDDALYWWYLKFFPLHRFPEFVGGMAAGVLFDRNPPRSGVLGKQVTVAIGIGTLLGAGSVPDAFLQTGILLPWFVSAIALFSAPSSLTRVLSSKAMVLLGRASYATYILHVPVFLAMARFDKTMWTEPSRFFGYAVVLLVVSVAAHRWIEEPCRGWLTRRLLARPGPA